MSDIVRLATQDFDGLISAARVAIETFGEKPASLLACAAGPVTGRHVQLTNAPWKLIGGEELATALELDQGLLLNDFEALAFSLPSLGPDSFAPLGVRQGGAKKSVATNSEIKVVVGPGTGLGVAALASTGRRYLALSSEAGHMGFAPQDDLEIEIFRRAGGQTGRVTAETFLSGPGLERLHQLLGAAMGSPITQSLAAPDIVAAAQRSPTGPEARSLRLFWRLLGRFCGDIALAFNARGGLVLAGDMTRCIAPLLDPEAFLREFQAKAPLEALACAIPVSCLQTPDAALQGLLAVAANPSLYVIDYANREWV